jgi:hypothetical protein
MFDSDVLISQLYGPNRGQQNNASVRVGTVVSVNGLAGTVVVDVAGSTLRDVPYAAGLVPVVGASVWIVAQGSWFAVIGASQASGQFGGLDEVAVGPDAPADPKVDLWMDTNDMGVGDGWQVLDQRYAQNDDVVQKAGDVMLGPLQVQPPTAPEHAASKGYVDQVGDTFDTWSSTATSFSWTAGAWAAYAVVTLNSTSNPGAVGGATLSDNAVHLP